jgi:hypothetical protein
MLAIDLLAGSDRYRPLVESGGNPMTGFPNGKNICAISRVRGRVLLYRATDPHWA